MATPSGAIAATGAIWSGHFTCPKRPHHVFPTRVASLLDTESERSYRDVRSGSLLELRIIPEMRVGRAAHDARPPGVESAEVALRDRGFRLTAPRHAVLEVVRGIKTHPTAEEVHRLVIRRAPGVSLGTVYRNLRLLVEAGLLGELPGPRARFDANTRAHHHFTCLRCGRIADVEAPVAEPESRGLSKLVEARTGLTITHHRIDFFGHCRKCQAHGRTRPGRRRPAADASARAANPSAR